MLNLDNYSVRLKILIAGLLLFVVHQFFGLNSQIQLAFFALGILITGIPHGSLDHFLYLKNHQQENNLKALAKFLFFYLGYALLYAGLWFLSPALSILLFILISAYHFGEMDLMNICSKTSISSKITSTLYGLIFLLNYLIFRWPEAAAVLSGFPGFELSYTNRLLLIHQNKFIFLAISVFVLILIFWIYQIKHKLSGNIWLQNLIHISILSLIVFNLPILLGFGFYFSCWHACLSIIEIRKSLEWDKKSWAYLYKKSLITNLAAFLMIAVLLFFFYGDLNRILAILFMSIAILTAPHVQVISNMFAKKSVN